MQECRNQMARYEYLHSAKKHAETYRLFALSRDDCWIENYDVDFSAGRSVKRFFVDFHENMDGTDVRGSSSRTYPDDRGYGGGGTTFKTAKA